MINDVDKNIQATTQKNITSFINSENATIAKGDFEAEIGHIKKMLPALLLKNKGVGEINLDSECITGINEAKNLLQVCSSDIKIDVLADGCKVTCVICQQYFKSKPISMRRYVVLSKS